MVIAVSKSIIPAAFAALLISCAGQNKPSAHADTALVEERLLTKYAISQCIARGYPTETIATDANAAAGGYLEHGNLEVDAYGEAVALAERALARVYKGQHGESLNVMKCLDLLGSRDLEQLTQRHLQGDSH
ncbi:MAG: hypothetical protein RL701_7660 [Pseudomonadota bacterium]|jgi:hypothetical protein